MELIDRFNEKWTPVTESGCWIWTANTGRNGYGKIYSDGKKKLAHRISYEIHVGPIPDGLCVCHHCDVPSCVNPSHLFAGTPSDNQKDSVSKGRLFFLKGQNKKGELNGRAKIKADDVLNIRAMYKSGRYKQRELANMYGLSSSSISQIITYKRWSYLSDE